MSAENPCVLGATKRTRSSALSSPDSPPKNNKRFQGTKQGKNMEIEVGKMSINELMGRMMEGFGELLEEKLQHFATKAELEVVKVEVAELRAENVRLNNMLHGLIKQEKSLQHEIEETQKHMRRKNLIFRGITKHKNQNGEMNRRAARETTSVTEEQLKSLIKDICQGLLNVPNVNIETIRMIEMKDMIIAEFRDTETVSKVLKSCKRLRGTCISVCRDLPKIARQKRNKLLHLRRRLQTIDNTKKTYIIGEQLCVDGKKYRITVDNRLMQGHRDGVQVLREQYGNSCEVVIEELGIGKELGIENENRI